MVRKTRRFGNQTYRLTSGNPNKSEAERIARYYRETGHNARIVRVDVHGERTYAVYTRPAKTRRTKAQAKRERHDVATFGKPR